MTRFSSTARCSTESSRRAASRTRSSSSPTSIRIRCARPLCTSTCGSFGREPGDTIQVRDLISGARWTWSDSNYVRLDAFTEPVHILAVEPAKGR